MNDGRSLERAARSWLDEGPSTAPDRVVSAALARIQTTSQEREPLLPWRLPTMNIRALGAGVATIVVIVALAALALPRFTGSGSSPNPSTRATPTPTPTVASTPRSTVGVVASSPPSFTVRAGPVGFDQVYRSGLYRYGMRYPTTWTVAAGAVVNAPDDLPDLASVPPRSDYYSDPAASGGVMVTSGPVSTAHPDLASFTAYVDAAIPRQYGIYAGHAGCSQSARTLVLDGEPAHEADFFCPGHSAMWITSIHAGYAFQVAWLDDGFSVAELQPKFDQFLQSFTFAP
jgi:hypothetical protein